MQIQYLLSKIQKKEVTKVPALKRVQKMNSKIVLESKFEDRIIKVYENGFITCVDENGNGTVFTANAKLSLENGQTTVINLAELNGELEAEDVLDTIGCFRLEHNKDSRNRKREQYGHDEERDIQMATFDSYTIESVELENELKEMYREKIRLVYLTLTDAQREVIELLVYGYTVMQIAKKLKISKSSVDSRIKCVKKKFQKHLNKDVYMGNGIWFRL